MDRCPECGHATKVARSTWLDRLWGLRPRCPERRPTSEWLTPDCGCTHPWHVAGT